MSTLTSILSTDQITASRANINANFQSLNSGNPINLLIAASGTSTSASAENVSTVAITGLTAKDTIVIYFTMGSTTQATASPQIYNSTDAVTMMTFRNPLAAADQIAGQAVIRQKQTASTSIFSMSTFALDTTITGTGLQSTFTTAWTGAWTLALRHAGVTAGGTFAWSWSVYKILGQ